MDKTLERFMSKIKVDDNGCWIWQGRNHRTGYSSFSVKSKWMSGHRWAYITYKGEIPQGLEIDHLCRVRSCVNPDHLEAVTKSENIRRIPKSISFDGLKISNSGRKPLPLPPTDLTKAAVKPTKHSPLGNYSHCEKGHLLTPENICRWGARSKTSCKACRNEYMKNYMRHKRHIKAPSSMG